jgi:hypothetical protein
MIRDRNGSSSLLSPELHDHVTAAWSYWLGAMFLKNPADFLARTTGGA